MKNCGKLILMILIFGACKKPYNPQIIASAPGYLVVEGSINSGADSTIIKLSTTTSLTANSVLNPVLKAALAVQSDKNDIYPLTEMGNGTYAAPVLNLNNSLKYRLSIRTAGGTQYLSDFEAVKITPPIDSVGYTVSATGIQLYVNTHDPVNNTKYYRWDYQETWQFHAKYASSYILKRDTIIVTKAPNIVIPQKKDSVKKDTVIPRTAAQQIYSCFGTDKSSNIILGSSAKLSQDLIYQNPITAIDASSEKIETKYSILVRQYALTSDAYTFWMNLKRNTEQLGSIFDAQPSTSNGNIHCVTNPSQPVIGYIGVSTVQQKRIFIENGKLPYFSTIYPYGCDEQANLYFNPITKQNEVLYDIIKAPPGVVNITSAIFANLKIVGYNTTTPECSDCTLRGFTKQPAYWK